MSDATATPSHDPDTGEIRESAPAPGSRIAEKHSALWFLSNLEDGAFVSKLTDEITDLNAAMNDFILDGAKKAKGKIVITIDLELSNGVFDIEAGAKITAPKSAPPRTVMWSTPNNDFSLEHPRQMSMFPRSGGKVEPIR